MIDLQAWLSAHPLAATAISWLVLSLLFWAFRPRTTAEYDKLPPRLAAFLQLLRATFGDGHKIIEAAKKIISGASVPPYTDDPIAGTYSVKVDALGNVVRRTRSSGFVAGDAVAATMIAFCLPLLIAGFVAACTPTAQATTAAAARIEAQRQEYREEVLACARQHAENCEAFNACQRAEARRRKLPEIGVCVERTRAEAQDAGLLDGARQ